MKYLSKLLFFIFLIGTFNLNADIKKDLLEAFGGSPKDVAIFESVIDTKSRELEVIKEELAALEVKKEEHIKEMKVEIDSISAQVSVLKEELKKISPEEVDFFNNKIALLNENYQDLLDTQIYLKKIQTSIEQQIKTLEEYLKDPSFKLFRLEQKAFYTFEDLQHLIKIIEDQKDILAHLQDQKNNQSVDLEKQKLTYSSITKDLDATQKEQATFFQMAVEEKEMDDIALRQKGELLDLRLKVLKNKKRLFEYKIQEASRSLALLNSDIFIVDAKVKVLSKELEKVKSKLRVDISSIEKAQNELSLKRQKTIINRDKYFQEMESLSSLKDKNKKELAEVIDYYKKIVGDVRNIDEWREEAKTSEEFLAQSHIGFINDSISLLSKKIELAEGYLSLEDEKFNYEKTIVDIMETLHKRTLHKFKTNEEINREIKKYSGPRSVAGVNLSAVKDKRNTATNYINIQNKTLNLLREKLNELQSQKDTIFKGKQREYARTFNYLSRAEKQVLAQIEINGKLIEVYSNIITVLNNSINQIKFISSELESIGIWHRSVHAISWAGVKNIIPDLKLFWQDFIKFGASYIASFNVKIITLFKGGVSNPLSIIIFIIKLLLIILLFIITKVLVVRLIDLLSKLKVEIHSMTVFNKIIIAILNFINIHLLSIFISSVLFVLITLDIIVNTFLEISYFLLLIVYLMYLIRKLIRYILEFNKNNDFIIFSQSFEKRFSAVFSIFAYSTIIILIFREAFILGVYAKSELPTILLATYSLILRFLVLFAIGKEDILNIMPTRTKFWGFLRDFIDKYYYIILILIAIVMIVGDPYVGGFGNLVYYLLTGIAGSILLIWGILVLHNFLKNVSNKLFFYTDEEVSRERFYYAKTWYGLFVIISFILLAFIGVFIAAWIWSKPVSIKEITNLLNYHLFYGDIDPIDKAHISITLISIIKLFGFLIGGFLIVYFVKKYVLRSIFDLLLVEPGVQSAIYSIMRYIIIALAIVLGFKQVGLSSFMMYVAVLVIGIGYTVKEPLSDLISYLLILVQRPIQIGDYIQLDEDTKGVVRKIAPRSVILRRKNSYTIIVPNSRILNQAISNWSYSRSFTAFNDILITVSYDDDPAVVKETILKALEANVNVLKNPQPVIRLDSFENYGYRFLVRGFVSSSNVLKIWEIASQVRFELVKEFKKKGVSIATPIRLLKITQQVNSKKDKSGQIKKDKAPSE